MGSRGPNKLPAAIVKQRGTYRPSSHPDEVSLGIDFVYNELPNPPEYFSDVCIQIWNKQLHMASQLYGYISYIDLILFERYCILYSYILDFEKSKIKTTYRNKNGDIKENPKYKQYLNTLDKFKQLSQEFGFSPSARTRIKLEQQKEEIKEPEYQL